MRTKRRILSISANVELGKLRAMVLRQAGYEVTFPSNRAETLQIIAEQKFDVLLIGHSISGQSAREYAEEFRAQNPGGKIIAIVASSFLLVKADRTVKAIDGPETLLQAIQEVLESA